MPIIKELAEELAKHDLGLAEASIRWLQHHSTLDPKKGEVAFSQPTGLGGKVLEKWAGGKGRVFEET